MAGDELALLHHGRGGQVGGSLGAALVAFAYVYAGLPNIRYDLALDVRASGSSGGLFTFLARASGVDVGVAFPSLVRADALSLAVAVVWTLIAAALVVIGRGRTAR